MDIQRSGTKVTLVDVVQCVGDSVGLSMKEDGIRILAVAGLEWMATQLAKTRADDIISDGDGSGNSAALHWLHVNRLPPDEIHHLLVFLGDHFLIHSL